MFSVSQNFLIYIIHLLILIHLVKMIDNVSQAIHVMTYLTSRVLSKVFNLFRMNPFSNPKGSENKVYQSINQFELYLFPH